MHLIKLTHANNNESLYVLAQQVFCFYYSSADNSVHLMSTGGGVVPVSESVEKIKQMITETKSDQSLGDNNVRVTKRQDASIPVDDQNN